jgi:uncharacterized protein YkwD
MTTMRNAHAMVLSAPDRSRRLGIVLALVICMLITSLVVDAILAAPAQSASPTRKMVDMINDTRRKHGLRALHIGTRMARIARRHSRGMARSGSLSHSPNLQRKLPGSNWGENVGVTPKSIRNMHRAFMRSSSHRSNILGKRYDDIGVGIVNEGRRLWVTEVFAG